MPRNRATPASRFPRLERRQVAPTSLYERQFVENQRNARDGHRNCQFREHQPSITKASESSRRPPQRANSRNGNLSWLSRKTVILPFRPRYGALWVIDTISCHHKPTSDSVTL